MDQDIQETGEAGGLDRRSLIKKAAVGTAVVWTAPVVASFTTPAVAAGSAGNPNPECRGTTCGDFAACSDGSAENEDCVCATTGQGGGLCLHGNTPCAGLAPCTADNRCDDPNSLCVVETCCGTPVCIPPDAFCPPSTARQGLTRQAAPQFASGTVARR